MEIKYMDPLLLNPYKNNPRHNDQAVQAVAESIKQFGFKVPITIDKDNVVVTGHTRLKAAIRLGLTEVPVIILDDLTPDQVKAFRLADNKVAEISEWDLEALAIELEAIDMDMSAFDFDITPVKVNQLQEDDYDPEPPKEPTSKRGYIYMLGRHRLMVGDATEPDEVEALMDGKLADLLLTDPPYNVDYEGTAGKIINDNMEDSQFQNFLTDAFAIASNHLKQGGAFYIWHADSERFNFEAACRRAGFEIRQTIIWNKSALVLGRQDYQWKHEPCLYGWKAGAGHYFIDDRSFTTVYQEELDIHKLKKDEAIDLLEKIFSKVNATIIDEDRPRKSEYHPTMKPIRLIGRQINNSTKPREIVLDPFGGSGSTLIAAEQLNRSCYMMELDPRYADVIIKRYEDLTGDKVRIIKKGGTEK
jgi:site-specific DNA-methyltransferase (adenine-specific)